MMDASLDASVAFSNPVSSSVLSRWERKQKDTSNYDRFITSQANSSLSLHLGNENLSPESNVGEPFASHLAQSLFEGDDINSKILACKKKAPKPETFQSELRVLYTANKATAAGVKRTFRHVSTTPERILDAPDLMDDYYLNLMDWSSQNMLAIALGQCLYMWNPENGSIELLMEAEEYISSVSWTEDGSHVAVGMSNSDVLMWHAERKKQVRCMKGHAARVGALAWNRHILSSGSRDTNIFHHDVRVAQHHVGTLKAHQQEICGLKWSPDGTQLASGGNDNVCCIWDAALDTSPSVVPRHTFVEATAAVKALAWSPHDKNLLATGAGTADRNIRFYDTQAGCLLNSIDTNSQVCSLVWNKHEREILSSHGFSQNQLTIWKYPSMVKVAELTGHTSRVLHTALSADGTTVVSAAADETLRFWKVFDPPAKKDAKLKPTADRASKLSLTLR